MRTDCDINVLTSPAPQEMDGLACHSRRAVPDEHRISQCAHPRVHARDQVVTPEICNICELRNGPAPAEFRELAPLRPRVWRPSTVAVIIPCHNYGRFLAEALTSVLAQTRRPDEVVVVDDSSDDNTSEVAARFASEGVEYLRVAHRHSQATRLAGFQATTADVVCFLDADDRLSPDYLEQGLRQFSEAGIGLVYSDVEYFGARQGRTAYPNSVHRGTLMRMNHLHSGCLVLREALLISGALEIRTDDQLVLQDWLLWRRLLADGWQARKQAGSYGYRQHGQSMTARWKQWGRAAERITRVMNPQAERTTYAYDSADRRTVKKLANGTRASFTYDAANRTTRVANLKSTGVTISSFQYRYDNIQTRTAVAEASGDRVTWSYDASYQLRRELRSGANAYALKPPGWTKDWRWGPDAGDSPKLRGWRWFDPNGGEWHWHPPDRFHDKGHWDYNPWDHPYCPWQNIYPQ